MHPYRPPDTIQAGTVKLVLGKAVHNSQQVHEQVHQIPDVIGRTASSRTKKFASSRTTCNGNMSALDSPQNYGGAHHDADNNIARTTTALASQHNGLHKVKQVDNPALASHQFDGGVHHVAVNHNAKITTAPNSHQDGPHQEIVVVERPASLDGVHQVTQLVNHALDSPQNDGGVHLAAVTNVGVVQAENTGSSRLEAGIETSGLSGIDSILNPEASSFRLRDRNLVHQGRIVPDLVQDWDHVQQVQAGGVGDPFRGSVDL